MAASLNTTFEPPTTKRRLIIKFSYNSQKNYHERDDDHHKKKKPIVTCYWVTGERTTKSQESVVVASTPTTTTTPMKVNDVVVDSSSTSTKIINNTTIVAAAAVDHKVSSTPTKPLKNQYPPKSRVLTATTLMSKSKECYFIDSQDSDVALAARNGKRKHDSRNGCNGKLKKDHAETELLMIKKNKSMEHYKRMQCWVIVKRMIEGKDGWALKEPLHIKYLKGFEKKNKSKLKAIGLKDIETKLKSYSTTDEFAKDMRFVFSHGLLYHPKHIVHRIALKFSETFENKWKSLNQEWTLEERIHKRMKRA